MSSVCIKSHEANSISSLNLKIQNILLICTILLSGTVLGTASMSTPEGIDKRTNQLCNEILVTPFAYGPCLFSNNTQKLLNKFDDERLYKVLNDSNIDGDIVKQISANVRNFFTDKFCPTVHTAIVIEQQQECAAYRRYSRLLQSWTIQLENLRNQINKTTNKAFKMLLLNLINVIEKSIEETGEQLRKVYVNLDTLENATIIRRRVVTSLLKEFFSKSTLSKYRSNPANPNKDCNAHNATTNATLRVQCAFDFMYHRYSELSALILNNLDLEESYYDKAGCMANMSMSLADDNACKAACELEKMIEQHTECVKASATTTDPVKCCYKFIYDNFPYRYRNKFDQALSTGGESGLVYSLKSLCNQRSSLIAFSLVDLGDYLRHQLDGLDAPRLDQAVIQSTIAYFIGALQQGLQCFMAGPVATLG